MSATDTALMDLVTRLYPICRSITGDGVRETLKIVEERLPLDVVEVPSGTRVFDWTVPDEWNISEAYIETTDGRRVVDFADHSLHVLNYSVPVDKTVSREELDEHLYSLPEQPDLIPYRTAYYADSWGFCLTHRQRQALDDPEYRVVIRSTKEPGALTYAECFVPGRSDREVVLYTHTCHPSLCNDNLSGIAVMSAVGAALRSGEERHYSYRLIFGPGTIGSITWLSQNRERLERIAHGLVVGLVGDVAGFTYKRSRDGDSEIDRVAEYVLDALGEAHSVVDFSPYGYDERQFGSPGINLPFGRLTRSSNGAYPEYHTSGDNLELVSEDRLQVSFRTVMAILDTLDKNRHYVNLEPYGEPQLGKRGLYRRTGGTDIPDREHAMLWLLNQADGRHSVLEIARKSGLSFDALDAVASELVAAGLLATEPKLGSGKPK